VKRLLREFFRRRGRILAPDHDSVVIARSGAGELAHEEAVRELESLFGGVNR
jgi:ribonuclease P protein component